MTTSLLLCSLFLFGPPVHAASARRDHPYLFLSMHDCERLKMLVHDDVGARQLYAALVHQGQLVLNAPPTHYDRNWASRVVLNNIYTLALLFRLSGDVRYRERLVGELRAVIAWPDWAIGGEFFPLGTAELGHAMAIAYDWLYHDLDASDRVSVVETVEKRVFSAYLSKVFPTNPWSMEGWNINSVCNGGVLVAALAFQDDPAASSAAAALGNASLALPHAFASYAPDGVWPEGVGYWGYGTFFALAAATGMITATGTDDGWTETMGFSDTGLFCMYNLGSAFESWNWGDSGTGNCQPDVLMFLARRFPALEKAYAYASRTLSLAFWTGAAASESQAFSLARVLTAYSAAGTQADLSNLPPARQFESSSGNIAFFRAGWGDQTQAWVGFKGCRGNQTHGDNDGGTFVFDMAGERWAIDLGGDNYSLPGYFYYDVANGTRYSYYRKATRGHNTLTFGGSDSLPGPSNQAVHALSQVVQFNSTSRFAVISMTEAYAHQGLTRCERGIALISGFEELLVVDEFAFGANWPATITWAMHTFASLTLEGPAARLQQGGTTLYAHVRIGDGSTQHTLQFSSAEVRLEPPQAPSPGLRKLMVETTPSTANRIVVSLSLHARLPQRRINPLRSWELRGPIDFDSSDATII